MRKDGINYLVNHQAPKLRRLLVMYLDNRLVNRKHLQLLQYVRRVWSEEQTSSASVKANVRVLLTSKCVSLFQNPLANVKAESALILRLGRFKSPSRWRLVLGLLAFS